MSAGLGTELSAIEDGSILILARENDETYRILREYIEENNNEQFIELNLEKDRRKEF